MFDSNPLVDVHATAAANCIQEGNVWHSFDETVCGLLREAMEQEHLLHIQATILRRNHTDTICCTFARNRRGLQEYTRPRGIDEERRIGVDACIASFKPHRGQELLLIRESKRGAACIIGDEATHVEWHMVADHLRNDSFRVALQHCNQPRHRLGMRNAVLVTPQYTRAHLVAVLLELVT